MQAVVFIGIQATGKSSFYRERFFDTHVRVNLDMLRTRHREKVLMDACLSAKQAFVVDNTNPTRTARARYIEVSRAAGFEVAGYFFQSALGPAMERNQRRTGGARVPDKGLRGTHARLELPALAEGFDFLHFVSLSNEGFVVEPWRDDL